MQFSYFLFFSNSYLTKALSDYFEKLTLTWKF